MEIKDLQAGQGKIDIVVEVVSVEEPRQFDKFGKSGKVAKAKAKDGSGEITMSLWNDQCDMVKAGMKVHITNGYVSEYKGEKQLGTGKFGKLELVQDGAPAAEAPAKSEENQQ